MRRLLLVGSILVTLVASGGAHALVWPDVPARVERDLGSGDASTRRLAARELQTLGPARGAPLVLQALKDEDDEVKIAAADSAIRMRVAGATELALPWLLGKDNRLKKKACELARVLPLKDTIPPLSRMLNDADQDIRQTAAEALGYQASPDAVPPLLGKLDDPVPAVRVQLVAALARLGDARAVVPLVSKARDSSAEVRQAVARALGDMGDQKAAWQALLSQLRDNSPEVKKEALASLGRLRASDAVDAIAPFLAERATPLRLQAFSTLGRIATPDAVRVLVGALGTGDDAGGGLEHTSVRDALVAAGAVAVPPLHALLDGQANPYVATSAAWAIGELKATSEAPTLVAAMRRGTLPTAAALRALAGAGTTESVAVVLEFVGDASPLVRTEAIAAATKLLDPGHPDGRAVEPLAAALRDTRSSARERAEIAALLGRTGAPRAAPVLIDLASAREPLLRLAAIDALGMLGPAGGDDVLLDKLANPEPNVRLHAAVALGDAGGAKARDRLLEKLDGGEEVDRTVILTALGGVLSRVPSEGAVQKLVRSLETAAGPERDALLQALGRATLPSAVRALTSLASAGDVDDRRTIATLLAAQPTRPEAIELGRAMLRDADAGVRAQAAWSLGAIGEASDIGALDAVARATLIDSAVNATGAIGRIAARTRSATGPQALCARLADGRAYVRANALAALSLAGARCGDGKGELKVLAGDRSDAVRAAAALAVGRTPKFPDDKKALETCAAEDHSGATAHRCRATPKIPTRAHAVEVYVVGEGATSPHPRASYALELADGLLHVGVGDRRGAVFDPAAPDGEIALRRSSALAR